jgi:hypothetical protein
MRSDPGLERTLQHFGMFAMEEDLGMGGQTPLPAPATAALASLLERRAHACRLTPDRALGTLDDAQVFLAERGLLTLMPDCALPSLFAACHEEPYQPGGHGFATWPKTKWPWAFALTERTGVHALKLHRGKRLYLAEATVAVVDPLCRAELEQARRGAHGAAAQELVAFLAAAGPSLLEDIKRELGLETTALRALRERLERVGVLISRPLAVEAATGGERETSELARWDQHYPSAPGVSGGLAELAVCGVRAAVVAPEKELARWFSWPLPRGVMEELIEGGKLWRPQEGWIAATASIQ